MAKELVRVLCVQGKGNHLEDSLSDVQARAADLGITVIGCVDLKTARKRLPGLSADADAVLLWTDVGRQHLSTTIAQLRETNLPLLVITGNTDAHQMQEAVGFGAHECFLPEELTGNRLARALRNAIRRQSWRMELNDRALESARAEAARSQQQLRDSEALYHSLVENLVQNIFRKDRDGRFTFANTNFCLTVGKHIDQVLGKTDLDLFPPELAKKYQADDHKVIATGEFLEAEEEHVNTAGEHLVVKVVKTPVFNAAGGIVGMQGIFWDITEQKRDQEALAASRERFGLAVRGSTDGIWDWDVATNEIYYSTRFKELLGYGYEELENRFEEWESRLHPDDKEAALFALDNHLQHDSPYEVECRLRCKGDTYRWFRARGIAVRNDDGRATRMAGSISDITTRREAEAQLIARTEDLERSNRDLEQFAYIASHDLKEPLRMVTSYVQLLEHRYRDQLGEDALEFIGFAVDGAKRMKRLIDGLLEFSRIGTHGQQLEPTSAEQVLQDSLANLEVLIGETHASVTHEPLPEVLADAVQLGQLFQNLIGNALKFCQQSPQIHVSAEYSDDDGRWIFAIRDNGIGIKQEHVDKIFQIYQRLHSRADYDGTGIGLAVCRKIIERHSGKIWVESTFGEGSTFKFTLIGAPGSV